MPLGQMAYRVTLPVERLKGIESLEDLITTPGNTHWIGPGATVLSYLLEGSNDTLLNLIFLYAAFLLGKIPRAGRRLLTLSTAATSTSAP